MSLIMANGTHVLLKRHKAIRTDEIAHLNRLRGLPNIVEHRQNLNIADIIIGRIVIDVVSSFVADHPAADLHFHHGARPRDRSARSTLALQDNY